MPISKRAVFVRDGVLSSLHLSPVVDFFHSCPQFVVFHRNQLAGLTIDITLFRQVRPIPTIFDPKLKLTCCVHLPIYATLTGVAPQLLIPPRTLWCTMLEGQGRTAR